MKARFEKYISYPIGLIIALSIFSAILLAMGFNPILSLKALMYGSFGTVFSASETFVRVAPLLLCSLAFLIAFKARFLNFGAEGQLYIGALCAYLAASQMGGLPSILSVPLVVLASFAGGVAWLAIPLVLKVKLEINEIFPTIVLNFIAMLVINWLVTGPIKDPRAPNPQTRVIPTATWLPIMIPRTRLHVGLIFAFFLAFLIYLILQKTVLGYDIRAVGLGPRAAKHGGIDFSRNIIIVGILSGGLAGLAGMVEVVGANHLLISGFSPGFGYQGIAIAALGTFHPIGVLFASIFYSILLTGGESMQRAINPVPIHMIYILQAVLVLSVLIVQEFLTVRRQK
jgi:simple sugar transport system permease protein